MKPTQTLQNITQTKNIIQITVSKSTSKPPKTKIVVLDYTIYHHYPSDTKPYEIIVPYSPSVQHEYCIDVMTPRTYKTIYSKCTNRFMDFPETIRTLVNALTEPIIRKQNSITIMKYLRNIDFPTVSRRTVLLKIPVELFEKIRREKQ